MIEVIKSSSFDTWLSGLRDRAGAVRILVRLDRLAAGNAGDHKDVGGGIKELRMTFGPGYRVYYMTHGEVVIVLLAAGDKSSQTTDIAKAKAIAAQWK